jgi:hypothetical protein
MLSSMQRELERFQVTPCVLEISEHFQKHLSALFNARDSRKLFERCQAASFVLKISEHF